MEKIYVSKDEYNEYRFRYSRENRIVEFWHRILHKVPLNLKKEIKSKRTDLIIQAEGKFDITGAFAYQFKTKEATNELSDYLEGFVVFVENNTEEILKWKENFMKF